MRTVFYGFSGWLRMQQHDRDELRAVDTAITIVGTLLAAIGWVLLWH